MEALDLSYNERLRQALLGRTVRPEAPLERRWGEPMFSFWGETLGFRGGDVHQNRAYRIYLTLDGAGVITDVRTVIEGELISPCSGYYPEALDAFDYGAVLDWCLARTADSPAL